MTFAAILNGCFKENSPLALSLQGDWGSNAFSFITVRTVCALLDEGADFYDYCFFHAQSAMKKIHCSVQEPVSGPYCKRKVCLRQRMWFLLQYLRHTPELSRSQQKEFFKLKYVSYVWNFSMSNRFRKRIGLSYNLNRLATRAAAFQSNVTQTLES